MKLVYLLGFLCLVAAESAKKGIDEEEYYKRNKHKKSSIAGGTEAFIQDMPFMATLIKKIPSYKSGLAIICTAVIIQPFWVLMTTQCLDDLHLYHNFFKNDTFVIRSNTAFANGSSFLYRDHTIEEYYLKNNLFDSNSKKFRRGEMGATLGLVKVKTEFNGKYEVPINIVPRNYQYKIGSSAIQAGWGSTETGFDSSARLRVIDTRLTNIGKCELFYWNFKFYVRSLFSPYEEGHHIVTRDMVCTRAHEERPCTGYPSGPLIQDGKLIGILGYQPCYENGPDVHTKLANFVDWIEDTIFNVTKRPPTSLAYIR